MNGRHGNPIPPDEVDNGASQPTGMFTPQIQCPDTVSQLTANRNIMSIANAIAKRTPLLRKRMPQHDGADIRSVTVS